MAVKGLICRECFHTQTHQERMYQEYVANKAKEKISQLEQYYEQIVSKTQTEITCILLTVRGQFE